MALSFTVMRSLVDFTAAASRHAFTWALRGVVLVVGACLVLALGFSLYAINALPDLQPWHTTRLENEFEADRHAGLDFAGYLALEQALFEESAAVAATWRDRGEAFEQSRFNADGAMLSVSGHWGR